MEEKPQALAPLYIYRDKVHPVQKLIVSGDSATIGAWD